MNLETVEHLPGQAKQDEIIPDAITLDENVVGSAPAIAAQINDELPEWLTEVPSGDALLEFAFSQRQVQAAVVARPGAESSRFQEPRKETLAGLLPPDFEIQSPLGRFESLEPGDVEPPQQGEIVAPLVHPPAAEPFPTEAPRIEMLEEAPFEHPSADMSFEQPSAEISAPEPQSVEQPTAEVVAPKEAPVEQPQPEQRISKAAQVQEAATEESIKSQLAVGKPSMLQADLEPPTVGESTTEQTAQVEPLSEDAERGLQATAQMSSERVPELQLPLAEPAAPVEEELPQWLRELAERVEPLVDAEATNTGELPDKEIVEHDTAVPVSEPEHETTAPVAELAQESVIIHAPEEAMAAEATLASPELEHVAVQMAASSAAELPAGQPPAAVAPTAPTTPDNLASQQSSLEPQGDKPEVRAAPTDEAEAAVAPALEIEKALADKQAEQPLAEQAAPSEFPDWMRELNPPPDFPPFMGGKPLHTEPPKLREDERDELPDWLRQPLALEGLPEVAPQVSEPAARAFTVSSDAPTPVQIPAYPPGGKLPDEPLEEAAESEGPLGGVRGVLPLAMTASQPHAVSPPGARQSDGALIFESVLAAAAAGSVAEAAAPPRAARRSWSKLWVYLAMLIAALIPLFIPPNLAALGFSVSNNTPTAVFYDKIQALTPGSTVLVAFDYDTGQAVEMNPAARAVVQDLSRRRINVVALSTLPAGAQIAQTVLDQASRENPGWNPGENYVNVGYIPGGEAGLRSLADSWLPPKEQPALALAPLSHKVSGLHDFALAIEFAGSGESLRAWMEQVQPRRQVTFVAVVSAAVESQARNYLGANQLAAFLRGLGGAAEYELFSNQAGLSVRTVDAQSFSQLALFAVIVLGNLKFFVGRLRGPHPSKS